MSLISYYDFVDYDEVSEFEKFGNFIRETSSQDESLYLATHQDLANLIWITMAGHRSVSPQVQLVAGRNMLGVKNKHDAIEHMKTFGQTKGRIYTLTVDKKVINVESISLP